MKGQQFLGIEPGAHGLSSTTELCTITGQPIALSPTITAQVVLNAPVANPVASHLVCAVRSPIGVSKKFSLRQEN